MAWEGGHTAETQASRREVLAKKGKCAWCGKPCAKKPLWSSPWRRAPLKGVPTKGHYKLCEACRAVNKERCDARRRARAAKWREDLEARFRRATPLKKAKRR